MQSIEGVIRDTISNRFIDGLNETTLQGPVIIALDTLEEMALHNKRPLLVALNYLREIREGYKPLRLLLSGRYNLEDRLPGFKKRFHKETKTHELQPFRKYEARAYLKHKRGLTKRTIVEAILSKSHSNLNNQSAKKGSNPFKLSLFADLYQQKEVKTAEEILSYPRTDFAYLINRVVRRIKEPTVQWLLRYAVV
ncbi:MAG: hypothetical protein ACRD8U_09105, partial [Pyrinomonadaceae bacterium]